MKKIIVFTAAFAMLLGGTALAADWNFYGSSRVSMFSETHDKDVASNPLTNGSDFTTTAFAQQSNSRIGANVAAGDVKGRFEYGTGVNVRLLYGEWNFGGGSFLVGQTYTPAHFSISTQVYGVDNNFSGTGATFSRLPALQLKFGGFKVALVKQNTTPVYGAYTATRIILPRLEASYGTNLGPVYLEAAGAYSSYEAVNPANDQGKDVNAFEGHVWAKYTAGPFMIGGSGQYGVNVGNLGMLNPGAFGVSTAQMVGTEIKDTTTMTFQIVGAFTISDMIGIEAGYGYAVNSYDDGVKIAGGASAKDDTSMSYYLQVPLTLADGVFIFPEVGVMDYDKDMNDAKEGKVTYFGAKFQINF